ncbi:MAG: hypothetical protein AAFZ65_11845, partial [Planctomycetota bacterium]
MDAPSRSPLRAIRDVGLLLGAALLLSQAVGLVALLILAGSPLAKALGLPGGAVQVELEGDREELRAVAAELSATYDSVELLEAPARVRIATDDSFVAIAAIREAAAGRDLDEGTLTLETPLSGLSEALSGGDPT